MDTDPGTHLVSDSIDTRARNALTLGLLSLLLGAVTGVPAIWVGRKALLHIEAADGALKGRWAAWTGIVLGCVSVALTLTVRGFPQAATSVGDRPARSQPED